MYYNISIPQQNLDKLKQQSSQGLSTDQVRRYTVPDIIKFTYYPLTTVYFVNEVHCTSNVLHSTTS